jgi:N6-adenosine-specific RNA methylase IME4
MTYRTIVADPPWRYTKSVPEDGGASAAERHYPTMTMGEIAALPVASLADENAHLYMWVTNPILTRQRWCNPDAVDIARAWGFEPKTVLTWIKSESGAGMGWFFRGDTEHVIFAVRGTLPIASEKRVSTVFRGSRGRHSQKPESFLDLVERVSPGPYVELFSRRARLGWDYRWHDGDLATVRQGAGSDGSQGAES